MFKNAMFNIFCVEPDLDMTKRAIESLGIQMEPEREMTNFEKNLVFPLWSASDTTLYVIRIYTTKWKYNKLLKKVCGRKVY